MATEHCFLGMGNPLLDISADVSEEFLTKYGVTLNNAILCEDKHQPVYKDLIDNHKVQYIAGGATQNTIRVAQWMLQSKGATNYIGCVGNDAFGKQLEECAAADGVGVHYMKDAEAATGTCAVLINSKERSLIANLSAANNYKIEHAQTEAVAKVITAAKHIYIAGFFLTVSPPTIQHVAAQANKTGQTFCMNLSAPFICQFFKDPLLAAMPHVDFLFGNEGEAEAIAGALEFKAEEGKESPEAAKKLTTGEIAVKCQALPRAADAKGGRVVVFTQGSESTCVVDQNGVLTEYAVPKVEGIVDVNGAGDAFVGGFMAAKIQGKTLEQSVHAGHYAASVILKVSGTTLSGAPDAKFA